jgi:hypothetical protein
MNIFKNCSKPLFQKILFTALIGIGCLAVGTAIFVFSRDTMMLALSGAVFLFSLLRCLKLYDIITENRYEIIEGTCVAVSSKYFSKHLLTKVMTEDGIESTLRLGKNTKLKIGYRYRFYFKQGQRLSLGSGYFDTALASDNFLGFEELGEYIAPAPETENK